ncbi:phosphate transport system regulatory protein PhoU [Salinigranum rubrum]|uniref:Phosphate-specific transport system accessory protein PhoU n=1 Tax=Salinigranum rubrum TaxID=755307 RepID=A0A2I8VPI4_9EURY|nr:phosphate signaling complex protein PhoU [Salinigranum rubrum]AUV83029.1 phosphate transport system regulatory protein PhoU [Salinigranum rubrum]
MPRDAYQEDLRTLREDVVTFGERVSAQLDDALRAIETDDASLATTVIEGDDAINERYLELEGDCIDLIALQQPVASDLRFVTASFKIITELERIGDLATNLSAYVHSVERPHFPEVNLLDVGRLAREMVDEALDAYDAKDPDRAAAVVERDDELDGLCERTAETVILDLVETTETFGDDELTSLLTEVNLILLTLRDIERVGDHAVNIAARSFYMATNRTTLLY